MAGKSGRGMENGGMALPCALGRGRRFESCAGRNIFLQYDVVYTSAQAPW